MIKVVVGERIDNDESMLEKDEDVAGNVVDDEVKLDDDDDDDDDDEEEEGCNANDGELGGWGPSVAVP